MSARARIAPVAARGLAMNVSVRIRIALVAVFVLATSSAGAAPKGGEARVQFDKGVAAYTKGDYAAAAEALGASFVLEADAETLFAWAQTERKLGHCERAIELYKKLLGMDLPAENKQAIQVQIGECKAILAEKPKSGAKAAPKPEPRTAPKSSKLEAKPVEPTPVEPVESSIVSPPEEPKPVRPEGRRWWKDPVGGALVGAGAIGLGLGTVFLVQGSAADSDKAMAGSYQEYEELANRAESRGRLGVIGLVVGGGLVAGGIVWYVTRKPAAEQQVSAVVLPSGAGVALSGRF